MQKGFATLEIILAIMIIGVLTKFAVPKAAQIIDTAALDYETKRFYSELRFVQAMGRSNPTVIKGMGKINIQATSSPTLFIKRAENYYQVFKDKELKETIREPHYFSHGVTIKFKNKDDPTITINFDSEGKSSLNSDTLTLTSRLGKNKYMCFDSVGRVRGSLKAK